MRIAKEGVMLNVVFTGPATDVLGRAIIRANLVAACHMTGRLSVQDAVKASTHVLVASRADTVKAKSAAARGVKVLTYPEFLREHLAGVAIPSEGKWNGFTDAAAKKAQGPHPADGGEGLPAMHLL